MKSEEQILKDVEFYITRILEEIPLEHQEAAIHKMKEVLYKKTPVKNIMYPNEMSDNGLIVLINHKFLHPLGLALMRDPDLNTIVGCLIAPDGKWEYPEETIEKHREKYNDFLNIN